MGGLCPLVCASSAGTRPRVGEAMGLPPHCFARTGSLRDPALLAQTSGQSPSTHPSIIPSFIIWLSSCLVSKSYCGTKNTETRPFHRWSMGPRQWDCHRCLRKETWLALQESSIGCAYRPWEVAIEYWIAPPPSTCNCRSTKKCRSTI